MAVDLKELLLPSRTAVLTMECQRGVVGDLASLPDLRDAVSAKGSLAAAARLCAVAREVGVRVVHCTVEVREDRAGTSTNCLIFALAAKSTPLAVGSEAAEIVPELDVQPSDIVAARSHGMTPFTSTSLDQILRNMGITTVVACGQSLNIGIPGMVMSAVDLGYHVVVPADAVAGVPQEYGDEVLRHTLPYLAVVTTTDEIIQMWQI